MFNFPRFSYLLEGQLAAPIQAWWPKVMAGIM